MTCPECGNSDDIIEMVAQDKRVPDWMHIYWCPCGVIFKEESWDGFVQHMAMVWIVKK